MYKKIIPCFVSITIFVLSLLSTHVFAAEKGFWKKIADLEITQRPAVVQDVDFIVMHPNQFESRHIWSGYGHGCNRWGRVTVAPPPEIIFNNTIVPAFARLEVRRSTPPESRCISWPAGVSIYVGPPPGEFGNVQLLSFTTDPEKAHDSKMLEKKNDTVRFSGGYKVMDIGSEKGVPVIYYTVVMQTGNMTTDLIARATYRWVKQSDSTSAGSILAAPWLQVLRINEIGEWDGVWTRRNNTNIFDATWRHKNGTVLSDVLILESVDGNNIVFYRQKQNGRYHGTISSDRKNLRGIATWYHRGWIWTGTVE